MREWLLNARKNKGMTQLEIAKKLGISEAYFNYIENGKRQQQIDLELASKLSDVLEIPLEHIAELEKQKGCDDKNKPDIQKVVADAVRKAITG